MFLTLSEVTKNPKTATFNINLKSGEALVLRPLESGDIKELTSFLENLSPQTRFFYDYPSFDIKYAKELCDAINRYDKLRFVLESEKGRRIIGIFEFSFGIPEGDRRRQKKIFGLQNRTQ